jgi:hypothetical protein
MEGHISNSLRVHCRAQRFLTNQFSPEFSTSIFGKEKMENEDYENLDRQDIEVKDVRGLDEFTDSNVVEKATQHSDKFRKKVFSDQNQRCHKII